MDVGELVKVEELLALMEAWPEGTFTQEYQRIHRRSSLDIAKEKIREMKVSMGGKERWNYLRRVEKIVGRLGIQDEQITHTQLQQQYPLRMLQKRINKHFKADAWIEFDKAQEEVDVLLNKINELKDTWYYEQCIRVRIYSRGNRKDGDGLRKAVALYKDIDIKKIFNNNGDIAWRYTDIMDSCFGVGVSDEGFSLMERVNSLLTNLT